MGFRIHKGIWQFQKSDGTYESKYRINSEGTLVETDTDGNEAGNLVTTPDWSNITSKPTNLSSFTNDLGNYGGWLTTSGKAADANLLDGLDSSRFVYGDGSNGKSINKTDSNANTSDSSNASGFYFGTRVTGMPTTDWWNWVTVRGNSWSGSDGYHFQLAGSFWSDDFRIRRMQSGSNQPWVTLVHSGNIGSQSVSNADTVDGKHANNAAGGIPTLESNGYWYAPSWINVGGSGIFSSTNGAHFLPNQTSPHGAWEMIGSRGGWSGIYFRDSANTLMANANESGFYNKDYGWQTEWYNGTLYISKRANGGGTLATVLDSSNYSSWAQPASTAINTGNIGSQSVNYATTAGSANAVAWGNVSGKPSTFAPSSHTHDDRYYTESESDSRFVLNSSRGQIGNSTVSVGSTANWPMNPAGGTYTTSYSGHGGTVIMSADVGGSAGSIGLEFTYNGQFYYHSNTDSNRWTSHQVWTSANFANNSGNWNTAYGWGNHASQGYITAYGAQGANGNFYVDDNYGNSIVGLYSATRYQGVWAMGDAYKLAADGTSTGSLYGIAWTHQNIGGESISGLGHQMLIMSNGDTRSAIGDGIWTKYNISTTSYGSADQWATAYGWGDHKTGFTVRDNATIAFPNTSWGKTLIVGGNGWAGDTYASVVTTNGNLHLDSAAAGGGVYLNWYGGAEGTYFGNGSSSQVGRLDGSGNLSISGTISASGYNKSNWDTAYGWGNHASAGYQAASTAITTSNIGSQSVSNADTVDSLHASSFLRSDSTNSLFRTTAGNGLGLRFWDSDNYKIWMSSTGDGTWGGRLDSSSDYNMYFKMSGGTNRGFAFKNSTTTVAQIDGGGTIYTASNGNSSQWDSAYRWGNHASAGYVASNGSTWTPHASTNRDASWNSFYTNYGYISFGPANSSWAHIYSDKNFYFNQNLYVNGAKMATESYVTSRGYITSVPAQSWDSITGKPTALSSFTNDLGNYGSWITASHLNDYTNGAYRVIADYISSTTWYIRSNGQFVFGTGHDWTASFRLSIDNGSGYGQSNQWAYFGQQDSNQSKGTWRGVRIRKYDGGARDGDLSAGAYYIGDTRKDTNWDAAYGWGNHASAGYLTSVPAQSWASITGKPSTFSPSSHTHDDRYYTESEINTLLAGKQAAGTYLTSLPSHDHSSISGTAQGLSIRGYGTDSFSFQQTSSTFAGWGGWANHFIGNHGNGATYYNTVHTMPFWSSPMYSRLEGGNQTEIFQYWTEENFDPGSKANLNGSLATDFYANKMYSDNWFRAKGACGLYFEDYGYGLWSAYSAGATYGNVSTYATGRNGWTGYSVNNWISLMAIDTRRGLFLTDQDRWLIKYDSGEAFSDYEIMMGSDGRNKSNVQTLTNSLDKVLSLRGVSYNYKNQEKTSIGFIAQEVKEVIPEVVSLDSEGYYAVGYQNLVAVLAEAIKEQQAQIDELKQIINNLTK